MLTHKALFDEIPPHIPNAGYCNITYEPELTIIKTQVTKQDCMSKTVVWQYSCTEYFIGLDPGIVPKAQRSTAVLILFLKVVCQTSGP